MEKFTECPRCGHKAGYGEHFSIYRCSRSLHYFCFKCEGSRMARECPECGSETFREVGIVE